MTTPTEPPLPAWQPLTRRGVAAFARATMRRLLLVQFLFAVLSAGCVVWFLRTAWFPVVTEAIEQLPAEGEIRSGVLNWHGESPTALAQRHFLAFTVDLDHAGDRRSPAHIQIEFGRTNCLVISLLGVRSVPYPRSDVLSFGRADLEPLWGAWRPALLGMAAAGVIAVLFLSWAILASAYALPVYLTCLFGNRDLGLAGSWRLAGAALMPGALLMALAILAYGLGVLDLIRLGLAFALHLVLGWVFVAAGALSTPRHPQAPETAVNPFAKGPTAEPPAS